LIPFANWHLDNKGPMETKSYGGNLYVSMLVDEATRYKHPIMIKSRKNTVAAIKDFEGQILRLTDGKQTH
jgi:hypothetical protein